SHGDRAAVEGLIESGGRHSSPPRGSRPARAGETRPGPNTRTRLRQTRRRRRQEECRSASAAVRCFAVSRTLRAPMAPPESVAKAMKSDPGRWVQHVKLLSLPAAALNLRVQP